MEILGIQPESRYPGQNMLMGGQIEQTMSHIRNLIKGIKNPKVVHQPMGQMPSQLVLQLLFM
jgi:hypothetical protein